MPEKKISCSQRQKYLCCIISTCKICLWKKCLEEYYQAIIHFISFPNENKNIKDGSDDSVNLRETHDSDDDKTVDLIFFLEKSKQSCMETMI